MTDSRPDPPENTTQPAGRGRALVGLLSFLERSMDDIGHTLPAVDHLSPPPTRPSTDELDAVRHMLERHASPAVRDAFDRWCVSEREFLAAVHHLEELRGHEKDGGEYRRELEQRIHAVRDGRAELRDLADGLREAVALELDA